MPEALLATLPARVIEALYDASGARRWDIAFDAFAEALARSTRHRFGGAMPPAPVVTSYLERLHLADLALATACANGHDAAWEHFVAAYRAPLRRAAGAIAGPAEADDLADALFADLFGLTEREGERRTLLRYYHGRSTLATWLRAVLAQRHVDALRARRNSVPIEANGEGQELAVAAAAGTIEPVDPDRSRLAALLCREVADEVERLVPRDRLRLSFYYRHDLTLAAIGRLLDEHESTVSRQLERTRRHIRAAVERALAERHRLRPADIALALDAAMDAPALGFDALLGAGGAEPAAPDVPAPPRVSTSRKIPPVDSFNGRRAEPTS